MMKALAAAGLVVSCLLLSACSDSKCKCGGDAPAEGGAANPDPSGAGGETTTVADVCHDGCLATLAAACSNGPADQATCESDCHALEAGNCGAKYGVLQACAQDQAVSCDAQGLPMVADCSDEQTAFVACLTR